MQHRAEELEALLRLDELLFPTPLEPPVAVATIPSLNLRRGDEDCFRD
jgi:hypothetical protein